jgi:hypothetical protein
MPDDAPPTLPPSEPSERAGERYVEGDAAAHLEELLAGELPPLAELPTDPSAETVDVELVGPHLRLSGTIGLGRFRRLSDFVNHQEGLIALRNATVLRRNGTATMVTAPHIWVSPTEISLIGQPGDLPQRPAPPDFYIPKAVKALIVVTPGHTLTGDIYITMDGEISAFVESTDPPFIPMTDVRTRSLADRRVTARYSFALVNRRHIVATTELQPGMAAESIL